MVLYYFFLLSNTEHTEDFKPSASSLFSLLFFHPKRPSLLEMADLPRRCHGNFPQRRATMLPCVAKCRVRLALEAMPSETGPNLATTAEEPTPRAEHVNIDVNNGLKKEGFITTISSKWEMSKWDFRKMKIMQSLFFWIFKQNRSAWLDSVRWKRSQTSLMTEKQKQHLRHLKNGKGLQTKVWKLYWED